MAQRRKRCFKCSCPKACPCDCSVFGVVLKMPKMVVMCSSVLCWVCVVGFRAASDFHGVMCSLKTDPHETSDPTVLACFK